MKKQYKFALSYTLFCGLICIHGYILFHTSYINFMNSKIANQYLSSLLFQIQYPLLALVLFIILVNWNGLSSVEIGFKRENIIKSLLFGFLFSIPFVAINLSGSRSISHISSIIHDLSYEKIIYGIIYYFIYISLIEELFFRGLLTEVINGIAINKAIGVLVISIMFGVMHLPFYIFQKMSLNVCIIKTLIAMIMHVVFWYLRKLSKGNIVGCIFAHGIIDFAGNIL